MRGVDRLNHYLNGADSAPIHQQAQHWHSMADQLRDIATNLKTQGDQLPALLGEQAGPAAQAAFHAAAQSLHARAEQFHQGHVAYKMAGDAIDKANSGRNGLPAEAPPAGPPPRPTTTTPDTAEVQQTIRWGMRQAQHQQSVTVRDNTSDALADHVDQQYTQATAIMKSIHGANQAKTSGGSGNAGGGGVPTGAGPTATPAYSPGPTAIGAVPTGGSPYSPAAVGAQPAPVSPVPYTPPAAHHVAAPGGTSPVPTVADPHSPHFDVPGGSVTPVAGDPGGPSLTNILTGAGTAGGAIGAGFLGLRGLGGRGGVPGVSVPGEPSASAASPGMRTSAAIPGEPEVGEPGPSAVAGSAAANAGEAEAEAVAMGGRGAAGGSGAVPLGGGAGGRGSSRKDRRGARDMWDDGSDWIDDEASGSDVVR